MNSAGSQAGSYREEMLQEEKAALVLKNEEIVANRIVENQDAES
jgi:hypothetical protein